MDAARKAASLELAGRMLVELEETGDVEPAIEWRRWCYRQQLILCGKPSCNRRHGPYWYAFRKVEGRTLTRYVGKALPSSIRDHERVTMLDGSSLSAGEVREIEIARQRDAFARRRSTRAPAR